MAQSMGPTSRPSGASGVLGDGTINITPLTGLGSQFMAPIYDCGHQIASDAPAASGAGRSLDPAHPGLLPVGRGWRIGVETPLIG